MVTVTNISKHLGATSNWVEEVVDSYKGTHTGFRSLLTAQWGHTLD